MAPFSRGEEELLFSPAAATSDASEATDDRVPSSPSRKKRRTSGDLASQSASTAPTEPALSSVNTNVATRKEHINVQNELERLHSEGLLRHVKELADSDKARVPKRALFDSTCRYFVGKHPGLTDKDWSKYSSGMIVVAIVIEEAEWDKIISDELEDFERRTLATEISGRA